MANSCGRATTGGDVGRERLAVLCRMLLIILFSNDSLIVFQRARGSDEKGWTIEAKNDFWQRL